jgi:hypothetical protein
MANVYSSAQHIPELEGVVRNAATIVLTRPDEVEGLQSLCLFSGRPVDHPTVGIFQALAFSPSVNLDEWKHQRERLGLAIRDWQEPSLRDSNYPDDETQMIVAALGLAHAI